MIHLIYDDDLDITGLENTNFGAGSSFDDGPDTTDGEMTWENAVDWAAASLTIGGVTDWRLPTTTQPDATCDGQTGNVPPPGFGPGCTGSWRGHLSYGELGGTANAPILMRGECNREVAAHVRG
jgi:hypothetical protein